MSIFLSCVVVSLLGAGFEGELSVQVERSKSYLKKNIRPEGSVLGVVVASPSKHNPDYWFHWTRDAALVMDGVVDIYEFSKDPKERAQAKNWILDYIDLSRDQQKVAHLGEPKFHVNGAPYRGPWGRPQNDGPALRALTLMRWVNLNKVGALQNAEALSVIKEDLNFIAEFWRDTTFDLWEEIYGDHFYTRMVQRKALRLGAELAKSWDDYRLSATYLEESKILEYMIRQHWKKESRMILPTLHRRGGIDYKNSQIDVAVLLAALHGGMGDGFFDLKDHRIQRAVAQIEMAFEKDYTLNQNQDLPALAIGRYPEDQYDGYETGRVGNPWFISTAAMAEFYFSLSKILETEDIHVSSNNQIFLERLMPRVKFKVGDKISKEDSRFSILFGALRDRGDAYLKRILIHRNQETGELAEQFHRDTGFMQGASHLTWSYQAFLKAFGSRDTRP